MARLPRLSLRRAFTGNISISAGSRVMERKNASQTPIAAMLPRSRKGGASLKFRLRKPTAVVKVVRNTGCRLTRRLSSMAARFSMPWRRPCRKFTRICTQSAMARVMMTIGTMVVGGDIRMPSQPVNPKVPMIINRMISRVVKVPGMERNINTRLRITASNMAG